MPHWPEPCEPEPGPPYNPDGSIWVDREAEIWARIKERRKQREEENAARKEQRRIDRLLNGPTPRMHWKSGQNKVYLDSVIEIIREDVKKKIASGKKIYEYCDHDHFSLNPYAKKYGISKKVIERYYFKRLEKEPL